MAIVSKEETLAFNFKIPRELHDEVDKVRKLAKDLGVSYDPSAALAKALKKDLVASHRSLEAIKEANSKRS